MTIRETARVPAACALAAGLLLALYAAADETVVVEDPTEGSVAPYVPTVEEDVELMLDVAGVGSDDYVIDLGSGDGRIVIAAARRGALAHGVEIEPPLIDVARRNARNAGVAERTAFVEGDIFEADIADASVVTLYLFPEANIGLRPKLLSELAPGTRVVSNSFDMGEWRPDVHDTSARTSGGILLWIVPADIAGEWRLEIADAGPDEGTEEGERTGTAERHALRIRQAYQEIDVTFEPDGAAAAATTREATLRGDRIAFRIEAGERSYAFAGRAAGDAMSGYVHIHDGGDTLLRRWRAAR